MIRITFEGYPFIDVCKIHWDSLVFLWIKKERNSASVLVSIHQLRFSEAADWNLIESDWWIIPIDWPLATQKSKRLFWIKADDWVAPGGIFLFFVFFSFFLYCPYICYLCQFGFFGTGFQNWRLDIDERVTSNHFYDSVGLLLYLIKKIWYYCNWDCCTWIFSWKTLIESILMFHIPLGLYQMVGGLETSKIGDHPQFKLHFIEFTY